MSLRLLSKKKFRARRRHHKQRRSNVHSHPAGMGKGERPLVPRSRVAYFCNCAGAAGTQTATVQLINAKTQEVAWAYNVQRVFVSAFRSTAVTADCESTSSDLRWARNENLSIQDSKRSIRRWINCYPSGGRTETAHRYLQAHGGKEPALSRPNSQKQKLRTKRMYGQITHSPVLTLRDFLNLLLRAVILLQEIKPCVCLSLLRRFLGALRRSRPVAETGPEQAPSQILRTNKLV